MNARCYRETDNNFHRYGALGVTVCERWRHSFENFLADMGEPPTDKYTLDRWPDKFGNYDPGNCRWADKVQQSNNLRTNVLYELNGISMTIPAWSRAVGVPAITIKKRLESGVSFDRAISPLNLRYGTELQSRKRRSAPD